KYTVAHVPNLSNAAMYNLMSYSFQSNVRKLENILERAYTLTDSHDIDMDDLQLPNLNNTQIPGPDSQQPSGNDDHFSQCLALGSLDTYLEEIEKEVLCSTLENSRWNKTLAAKKLGISFRSLRYRLKKLGLDNED